MVKNSPKLRLKNAPNVYDVLTTSIYRGVPHRSERPGSGNAKSLTPMRLQEGRNRVRPAFCELEDGSFIPWDKATLGQRRVHNRRERDRQFDEEERFSPDEAAGILFLAQQPKSDDAQAKETS
jgi:hypothetical protein